MAPERIIIVDREPRMVNLLRQVFTGDGYAVHAANQGEQAVQMTAREQPALVILDMALTCEDDGFEVVRQIRQFSEVPIIMLSASARTEDALRGYSLGADDYVIKPFDPKILLARTRALLKRCKGWVNAPAEIVCGDVVIDLAARRVSRASAEIHLTDTEYNLLIELARHRNRVLTHDQLLIAVWGRAYQNEVGYLRSYVHILRRKLEQDPINPRLIISRPGIGYMLRTEPGKDSGD